MHWSLNFVTDRHSFLKNIFSLCGYIYILFLGNVNKVLGSFVVANIVEKWEGGQRKGRAGQSKRQGKARQKFFTVAGQSLILTTD